MDRNTYRRARLCAKCFVIVLAFAYTAIGGDGVSESFAAASVKVNRSGDPAQEFRSTPGRLTVKNMTLRNIIKNAYRFREDERLQGTPAWADTERFDIVAASGDGAPPDRLMSLLQSLLVERFHLAAHHETREIKCYALEAAPGGPKLRELKGGVQPRKPNSDQEVLITLGRMSGLVTRLSSYLGGVVIDRTGLTGTYDLALQVPTVDAAGPSAAGDTGEARSTAVSWNPAILSALKEQLGLLLVATRAPVDVLVVDHLQRPTPN